MRDNLRIDGFDFTLLKRVGDICLYSKIKPGGSRPTFEVVKVRHYPAHTVNGRLVPAGECMPSSEQWGQAGWSYPDLEGAEKRFLDLQTRPPSKATSNGSRQGEAILPQTTV